VKGPLWPLFVFFFFLNGCGASSRGCHVLDVLAPPNDPPQMPTLTLKNLGPSKNERTPPTLGLGKSFVRQAKIALENHPQPPFQLGFTG